MATNAAELKRLIGEAGVRWSSCRVHPDKEQDFLRAAGRLVSSVAREIYRRIEARTGVPWFVVAVIHERESGQKFSRSIAQGDPWDKVSVRVPKGRGPFKSFDDAAYDALVECYPHAARWTDWSIGGILVLLEQYNGLGYAHHGMPSPYIWSGTNQYVKGKYTSDGHLDLEAVDAQLGCAGLLMAMKKLDPGITFGVAPPAGKEQTVRVGPSRPSVPVVRPAVPAGPSITNPAAGSIGDAIAKIFGALFGRH